MERNCNFSGNSFLGQQDPVRLPQPQNNWKKSSPAQMRLARIDLPSDAIKDTDVIYTHQSTQSPQSFMVIRYEGEAVNLQFHHQQNNNVWDHFENRYPASKDQPDLNQVLLLNFLMFCDTKTHDNPRYASVPQSMVLLHHIRQDQDLNQIWAPAENMATGSSFKSFK